MIISDSAKRYLVLPQITQIARVCHSNALYYALVRHEHCLGLFFCFFNLRHFLPVLWTNGTSQTEGSRYRGTWSVLYSFSNELSSSFTCPLYSTDIWDLGLKSHPNDMVQRGIELTNPGFTVMYASIEVVSCLTLCPLAVNFENH